MTVFSIGQRLKTALGGFLAFTGLIILVSTVLVATNSANLFFVFEGTNGVIALSISATLEIVGGLVLFFGSKKFTLSFAGNEKETDKNTD
jgi:type IV secretory pathway VirB2 component (pilin)